MDRSTAERVKLSLAGEKNEEWRERKGVERERDRGEWKRKGRR